MEATLSNSKWTEAYDCKEGQMNQIDSDETNKQMDTKQEHKYVNICMHL